MTIGLRRSLVAALIVALTLAGLGRALASTAQPSPVPGVIAGLRIPICHSAEGKGPARPGPHDCCDEGALLAPVVLPSPPALVGPAPVGRFAEHGAALAWAPLLARPRGPRLSRGPPPAA